jgi:peptidyl-prolyl cis-trans isomerase SurA
MRKIILFLGILALAAACTPNNTKIVAEFNDTPVKLKEFEKAYIKNVGDYNKARISPERNKEEFLKLYVDFKMKLRDAWVRGYYSDPDLNKEINNYKKKIGATYIKEKKLIEKGMRELYNQRKWEYRLSHIMLRPDKGGKTNSKDLAQKIINEIKSGKASFEELAKKYSADRYSKNIGGDIYWFTPGMINRDFDKAMISTPVGNVYGKPVRSRYGWHVIKVTAKQKRTPRIKIRHILIRFAGKNGKVDSAAALAKIKDIKKQLEQGADFVKLAKKYSEDPGSAKKGGDLGYISRRMMVKPFDEAAFNLKKPGEISDIVKTRYGYHIIQLIEIPPYPSFDSVKDQLRKMYQRQRYKQDYNAYIDSLKTVYNFRPNNTLIKTVAANKADSIKFNDNLFNSKLYKAIKDSVVFTIENQPYKADSLFRFLINNQDFSDKVVNENNFTNGTEAFAAEELLEKEAMGLEKSDSAFKQLLDDYRNGIYIFKLQQEEVWNKVNVDTNAVKKYFEANRNKYKYPDRVEFYEIFTKKDSLAKKYYSEIQNGAKFDSLAKQVTERFGYRKKSGHFDLTPVSSSIMADRAWKLKKPGDVSKPFKTGKGFSIVKLVRKDPAHLKTYEEAKQEALSDYQEKLSKDLENAYVESLRARYHPEYYYNVLKEAFKKK